MKQDFYRGKLSLVFVDSSVLYAIYKPLRSRSQIPFSHLLLVFSRVLKGNEVSGTEIESILLI